MSNKRRIRIEDIPAQYVLDLCNATTKGKVSGKGELQLMCPVRPNRWFEYNLAKGGWKCYKDCADCPAGGRGGKLDLYVLYHNCADRSEAFKEVVATMEGNEAAVEKRRQEAPVEKKLEPNADPDTLDKTYTAFLDMLSLSREHRKDLVNRGVKPEDIEKMGFKSLPQNGITSIPKKLIAQGFTIQGVPGFFTDKNTPKMNLGGSGYFIPYRDENGKIVGLQIRYDIVFTDDMSEKEIKDLKKRRYRWFTSSGMDSGAAAQNVPFYGIPKTEQKETVYATEGGLKATVAQSLSGGWFVAIPGVNCYSAWNTLLDWLKEQNVTTIVDAFDSDRADKKEVASSIAKLHKIASEKGLEMKTWDWGTEHKGVDDYLLARKIKKEQKKKGA